VNDPETIHAICEGYRAGATVDRDIDESDRGTNQSNVRHWCSGALLASSRGGIRLRYGVDGRPRSTVDRSTAAHLLAGKAPIETYQKLRAFFAS
jgi:haloacetate dehalogenase